jgi:hypothetical protein
MSSQRQKKLLRHQVGALPLIQSVIKRINLKQILYDHVKSHGNEIIPAAETLLLLVYNWTLDKYFHNSTQSDALSQVNF